MKVPAQQLSEYYEHISDEEFARVIREQLTRDSQRYYDRELARRNPEKFWELQQQLEREAEERKRLEETLIDEPRPTLGLWTIASLGFTGVACVALPFLRADSEPPTLVIIVILILVLIALPAAVRFMRYRRAKREWKICPARTPAPS